MHIFPSFNDLNIIGTSLSRESTPNRFCRHLTIDVWRIIYQFLAPKRPFAADYRGLAFKDVCRPFRMISLNTLEPLYTSEIKKIIRAHKLLFKLSDNHQPKMRSTVTNSNNEVVVAAYRREINFFNLNTKKSLTRYVDQKIEKVQFIPGSSNVLVLNSDGMIKLVNLTTTISYELGVGNRKSCSNISLDGTFVYSGIGTDGFTIINFKDAPASPRKFHLLIDHPAFGGHHDPRCLHIEGEDLFFAKHLALLKISLRNTNITGLMTTSHPVKFIRATKTKIVLGLRSGDKTDFFALIERATMKTQIEKALDPAKKIKIKVLKIHKEHIILGLSNGEIHIRDLDTGALKFIIQRRKEWFLGATSKDLSIQDFDCNERYISLISKGLAHVELWDLMSGLLVHVFDTDSLIPCEIKFQKHQLLVGLKSGFGKVIIWDSDVKLTLKMKIDRIFTKLRQFKESLVIGTD